MRLRRRTEQGRWGMGVAGTLALHAALVGAIIVSEGMGKPRAAPRMRVYAVNIVSPPPNARGEPPAESPAPSNGGAAANHPAPPAPPAAAETPPAPQPKPTPPAAKPNPPTPAPHPAPTPPKPAPQRPPATPPARTPAAGSAAKPASSPATPTRGGTPARGTASGDANGPRSQGTGTRGAATGRNPDASSPGGEGLNVSQPGMECPSPGYCENIVRQVRRYFRRPEESSGTAEACFRILRDGSVDDIDIRRVRGGFAFRLAVQEAVEQAGMRKAFGSLPAAFRAATLPVCVDITPES